MSDLRARRVDSGRTKIRTVPIAVTPEGFWCCPCPSQAVLQKTFKNDNNQTKQKPYSSPLTNTQNAISEKNQFSAELRSRVFSEDHVLLKSKTLKIGSCGRPRFANAESLEKKLSIGFGQQETSDLKVIIAGKEGDSVKLSVHRDVLVQQSKFFAEKISGQPYFSQIEMGCCDDVEIFVETMGLMYCKEMKQRLLGQGVLRVLSILNVAESLGFNLCIETCLEYLEAIPWVGEEEEESVVSSIRNLPFDEYQTGPIMKRLSSSVSAASANNTLALVLDLVLKSKEDNGREKMKALVLKLLHENGLLVGGSVDTCIEAVHSSCRSCLSSMSILFERASEPEFAFSEATTGGGGDTIQRQAALEVDNLLWLVSILGDVHRADEFVLMWGRRTDLAAAHSKLPAGFRHLLSRITARLFVGIGKGEMLPCREARRLLLKLWLQPLIDDYNWLRRDCRSFDRKIVEEGVGRTILTLPLEEQQDVLLSWLGSFLRIGDGCPDLHRAFEVWWRRTFIRPHLVNHHHGC